MTFVPIRDAVIIAQTNAATIKDAVRRGIITTDLADDGEPLYELVGLVKLERILRNPKNLRSNQEPWLNLARRLDTGCA